MQTPGILLRIVTVILATTLIAGCSKEAKKTRFLTEADNYFKAGDFDKAKLSYLNVVRPGSTVSKPRAVSLDTGEELRFEVQRGDSEVVVFHFPPVKAGQTTRLRMFETYTDSARYKLVGDQLVWNRSFGRASNAVVLPAGWQLTNSSIPATVSELPDGRIRLDFINARPDEIAVLITARRRAQ